MKQLPLYFIEGVSKKIVNNKYVNTKKKQFCLFTTSTEKNICLNKVEYFFIHYISQIPPLYDLSVCLFIKNPCSLTPKNFPFSDKLFVLFKKKRNFFFRFE